MTQKGGPDIPASIKSLGFGGKRVERRIVPKTAGVMPY
jgi:hypothetical protein